MKRTWFAAVLALDVVLTVSVGVFAADYPQDVDAWLRETGFGPYAPEEEDWDAVYEKAKQEGRVVIYTSSSRTIQIKEEFEALYPGIEVEVYHLGTTESINKLHKEQLSGIYNCDIIHASGYPTQLYLLAEANMVFPYYPPELKDVIPQEFREPLTAQRYEARGVFYNDAVYGDPIESWWELTLPEWRGKIAMVDPIVDASTLDFITTIVANADDGRIRTGLREALVLTEECGLQAKSILDNGVRLYNGHRDVGDIVGDTSIAEPPSDRYGLLTDALLRRPEPGRSTPSTVLGAETGSRHALSKSAKHCLQSPTSQCCEAHGEVPQRRRVRRSWIGPVVPRGQLAGPSGHQSRTQSPCPG